MTKGIRPYANAVWIALIRAILERWDEKEPRPITYGDIRTIISGSTQGSQSTNRPLGYIHGQIKFHNEYSGEKIPQLNALVVNKITGQPGDGIPSADQSLQAKKIWRNLRKLGKAGCLSLGEKALGFHSDVSFKDKKVSQSVDDAQKVLGAHGPEEAYLRKAAWSNPKHHPASKAVEKYLNEQNCSIVLGQKKVGQDYYVIYEGKKCVIEVKPYANLQSIATGVGQLLIYGAELKAKMLVLAIPKIELKNRKTIATLLKHHNIRVLPLVRNSKNDSFSAGKIREAK